MCKAQLPGSVTKAAHPELVVQRVGAELLSLSVTWLKIFFPVLKLCLTPQTWAMHGKILFLFLEGNHCAVGRLQVFPLLTEVT